MWSLEFAAEKFPQAAFVFHVLLKRTEGSYEDHGYTDTATEAFQLRRDLISETGETKYFVRARRLQIIDKGFQDSNEDTFRDALRTGDTSNIPDQHRAEFDTWAKRVINERPEYARVNRDQPRWSNR